MKRRYRIRKPDSMKIILRLTLIMWLCLAGFKGFSQYKWKLSKEKDGIKVFLAENPKSKYKSIRVECTLQGSFDKLIAVLTNVDHLKDWVYNTKTSYLIKKITPYELYYYMETSIPWPMSNRDAVVHLRITKDSLQRFVKVSAISEPLFIPERDDKIRIPRSNVSWHVTMPTKNTISIIYVFEADPGGNLPGWVVNSFADKGPYESFKKLSEMLKR
jgi:START domain